MGNGEYGRRMEAGETGEAGEAAESVALSVQAPAQPRTAAVGSYSWCL